MNLKDCCFTKAWTLFLDRDGVISVRKPDDYVRTFEEFEFIRGVPEAISTLSGIFGRIIIVSNQQGVAKGLMRREDLVSIDDGMKQVIRQHGGRIDASYYATGLASENHPDRKPRTGMGLKAKAEFPEIDFSKSVMVGDSITDMEFGKNLGMINVFISPDNVPYELADFSFDSLLSFSAALTSL